jgi:hypothetical protein
MFSFHPFFHVTKMGLFRGLDELDFWGVGVEVVGEML